MFRKIKKPMWKERQRKSPRFSALGTFSFMAQKLRCENGADPISFQAENGGFSMLEMEGNLGNGQGPASRTRGRKKRKLRPVGEVVSSLAYKEGGETGCCENHQTNNVRRVVNSKYPPKHKDPSIYTGKESSMFATRIPEKRVLDLVLDILQRRDTHEIFAEPVDPNEVEDYYSIIEEPMDFGTMRAKLHEGMYRTLEEFEHDVFLVTKNAMHFNSSATIYFRQARAINELAQKVFHSLKSDPKHFELECLEVRQRSGRRFQVTYPVNGSPSKMAKDGNSKCMKNNVSSKILQSLFEGSSNLSQEKPGISKVAPCIDAKDHEVLPGNRYGHGFNEDHRHTYKPWTSFISENELVDSTIYRSSVNPIELVAQKDISYSESLMLFVKDLGPRVQMIAKYRLPGWFPDAFCCQTTPSSRELLAAIPLTYSTKQMDTGCDDKKIKTCNVENIDRFCSATEEPRKVERMIESMVVRDIFADGEMESFHVFGTNNVHHKPGREIPLGSGNGQVSGESSPTSEYHKPNCLGQGLKNSDDPSYLCPLQTMYIPCSETNIPKQKSSQLNQAPLPTSQFIFDLPFLKNQLDQMNSTAKEKCLQQHSSAEKERYFEMTRREYESTLPTGKHQAWPSSRYGADVLQDRLF